ncbi:MAG: hypothetical protein E7311_00975 [Clostridiales bacterium]|nr:hypothetical protein [Clostridiales bacterium]
MKKRSGISLVSLVITIIVLIILTGTVIVTFMEGGIIEKAKEAVNRSNYVSIVEAYDQKYMNKWIEVETEPNKEMKKIEILEETVNELGIEGFTFNEEKTVVNYTGENTDIKIWVMNNFKYETLKEAGYMISIVGETPYVTGIKIDEVYIEDILTTAKEILDVLPEGYTIPTASAREGGIVATGDKIYDEENKEYITIIVKGELTGDDISVFDAAAINRMRTGKEEVTDLKLLAGDVDNDGDVDVDDANFITDAIAGYHSIEQNVILKNIPELIKKQAE